jgi:hypothetical protein
MIVIYEDLRGFNVNTVYAVWTGYYSDRDVVAIFSTQALADAFCEEHNKLAYGDARVEIYEVDDQIGYKVNHVWEISIYYDTGELFAPSNYYRKNGFTEKLMVYTGGFRDLVTEYQPSHIVVRSSKSADHADKLAIEARQEYQRLVSQGMSYPDINQLWRQS